MNIRSKSLALILCAGTVLSLAACGGDGDVAGDDWRTTGLVAASGTITHDGQSVDVVVTVDEESAAFYWDRPEQLLAARSSWLYRPHRYSPSPEVISR